MLREELAPAWIAEQQTLPNSARPTLVQWLDEFDVARARGGIESVRPEQAGSDPARATR